MSERVRFQLALAAAALLIAISAQGAVPTPVLIGVDATAEGTPLKSVWAYFGYDEVNATTTPEGRELLHALAQANTEKVRVRTHFLFNSGERTTGLKWGSTNIYSEDALGVPVFDFSRIDAIMDAKREAGVASLFELAFMPQALSSRPEPYESSSPYVLDSGSFYPPRDYEKWGNLVRVWAERARDRHGQGEPDADWRWELWNEPDIGYFRGTPEEFQKLYDYTEAALHGVLPNAPLGGPAAALPHGVFLKDFLEHCATGQNAVSGAQGTRLDFVTFHAKGGVARVDEHVQLDLGRQMQLHRVGFEAVAASAFADKPVIISEADPDGCAACPSTVARYLDYRNSPAYGAYEVAMMKRSLDLAEDLRIDLKGVLTWAFTFPDTPYFAGYRALATNGIHLPVLNAFKLLGALSGRRLPVTSTGARPRGNTEPGSFREQPDVDALAASSGNRVQVLVWHYHDDLVPAEPVPVTVEVEVAEWLGDYVRVHHQRVDGEHANAFATWERQGRPATPSDSERAELVRAMDDLDFEPDRVVRVEAGRARLTFQLPRFGVSLLTLSAAAAPEPVRLAPRGGCVLGGPGDSERRASGLVGAALMLAALVLRRNQRTRQ